MSGRRDFLADGDEEGVSIIELLVSMSILSIVLAVFFGVLVNVQNGVTKISDRTSDNDEARLAVQQIDREVRSGNVFYDPVGLGGLGLRVYTQTNAPTRPSGHRCIEWRIASTRLESRSWSTSWQSDSDIAGWRVVARNVTNTSANPAFVRPTPSLLQVNIAVRRKETSGGTVNISSTISGRNTQYGYPTTPCDAIPPA